MNLEVQIWNVHLVKAFNTHVQEAEFLYSLLSAENKRKNMRQFLFSFTQKLHNKPKNGGSETTVQSSQEPILHSCPRQD